MKKKNFYYKESQFEILYKKEFEKFMEEFFKEYGHCSPIMKYEKGTQALWKPIAYSWDTGENYGYGLLIGGVREPDFTSGYQSMYWYSCDAVYRIANHWGQVGPCKWNLRGQSRKEQQCSEFCWVLAKCNWEDFKVIPIKNPYYIFRDFPEDMQNKVIEEGLVERSYDYDGEFHHYEFNCGVKDLQEFIASIG